MLYYPVYIQNRRMCLFWPFSSAAQVHISVSAQGGVQSRKGYPFLVPARPGRWPCPQAGADRLRLWLACWMRAILTVRRAVSGRVPCWGGARLFAGCAVRRSSSARCGARPMLTTKDPKRKHERMGEHEQDKDGQTSCVITAFSGDDAFSAADDGVRRWGGRSRTQ